MPSSKNYKRNYQREYEIETPKRRHQRVERNQARTQLVSKYGVDVLKGKDVGHKKALSRGGLNALSNFLIQSPATNRAFSRTKTGKMKSERSRHGK